MDVADIHPALVHRLLQLVSEFGVAQVRDGIDAIVIQYYHMNPSSGRHAAEK